MTTTKTVDIALEGALVIDPRDFGATATGAELTKLLVEFCNRNSNCAWQFELTPDGEIIAMPATHHPSDGHEGKAYSRLDFWTDDHGDEARPASSAFEMPVTGGVLCPDASWTSRETWDANPHVAGDAHHLCPEFVIEIRSTSVNLAPLHAKMRLYIQNGALLGWLIDARNRHVYIYRSGQPEPEMPEDPATLSGEDVLHGFTFEVARWIFDRV